jgi:hypothetical protein
VAPGAHHAVLRTARARDRLLGRGGAGRVAAAAGDDPATHRSRDGAAQREDDDAQSVDSHPVVLPGDRRGRSMIVVRRVGSGPVASVAELMERMLQDVFNEPDPARRDAAIAETFTEDVVFEDAEGTVAGRAALAAKVTELLAQGPGFVFVHDGPLREIPETLGVRAWRLGPPGGSAVLGGLDVAVVCDGLIATLYSVLDGAQG